MNVAQHKIVNLLKIFFFFWSSVFTCVYLMCGQDISSVARRCQKVGHPCGFLHRVNMGYFLPSSWFLSTADPQIMFHLMLFCYNVDEEKNWFPGGHCLCETRTFSPKGFFRRLSLGTPTSRRRALEVNWHSTLSQADRVWVRVNGPGTEGRPVHGWCPPCALSCRDGLQKWLGK